MRYVVVTGGVISGLGKGITTSSLARLLKARGIPVTVVKIDPYLNVDAGTMNPYQHGEVFVLDDGTEVDLDLGNYERFLGESLPGTHNLTTGKVYRSVIEKERRGDYLGNTVQIIPHVTGEVKRMLREAAERSKAEVVLVEVGGTVGDIESMPFLEALRELQQEVGGRERMAFVHTTLVPVVGAVGEAKTKPTQHSVRELRSLGIQPDMIVARGPAVLTPDLKAKISLFCDVPTEAVIAVPDLPTVYQVPLHLESQGVGEYLCRRLGLAGAPPEWGAWNQFLETYAHPRGEVTLGVVGKYVQLKDAYLSHIEAFHHCQGTLGVGIRLRWFDSEDLVRDLSERRALEATDGILVPGGYGTRGAEGKIAAAEMARTRGIPFLGICLGFQMATVEAVRHLLGFEDANSSEFDPHTPHPAVTLLDTQDSSQGLGGTQRLGSQPVDLVEGSLLARLYGRSQVFERHRHRYEVNPEFVGPLAQRGFVVSARSPDGRVEGFEMTGHPFYLGVQYHPEFLSRPQAPHQLFQGLVRAAVAHRQGIPLAKEESTRVAASSAVAGA
jgi:CTP synthase